jgi:hypothetical protein
MRDLGVGCGCQRLGHRASRRHRSPSRRSARPIQQPNAGQDLRRPR